MERLEEGETVPEPPPREVPDYELFEAKPENHIEVLEQLENPHPHVARERKLLEGGSTHHKYGWIYPKQRSCLDINVTPGTLDRALRIMDALLKALQKRGFGVEVIDPEYDKATTCVVIRGERVFFGIFESPHKGRRRDYWSKEMVDGMVPSGRLVLRIRRSHGAEVQFRDQKTRSVEDRLNEFTIRLHKKAIQQANYRIAREKERIEEEERRQRREEIRRQQEAEAAKLRELEALAANWRRARDIREFLKALEEARQLSGRISPESELGAWLTWANGQADRIDPLTPDGAKGESVQQSLFSAARPLVTRTNSRTDASFLLAST